MSNIINSLYASPGSISEGDDERKLKSYVVICPSSLLLNLLLEQSERT